MERVQREYPATKVVFVESVEDGIPKLAAALGIAQYGGAVARNTADWPFAD